MNDCTIIIPTHNRPSYLKRSVEFFSGAEFFVIYADSSTSPAELELSKNISYMHLPNLSFAEKSLVAIKAANTQTLAFCADDDFILKDAMNKGLDILQKPNQACAVVGYYLGFYPNSSTIIKYQSHKPRPKLSSNKAENIASYMSEYRQCMWALFRKEHIKTCYEVILEARFSNDNFYEMVIATVCSALGGIHFTNEYWGVREIQRSDNWGVRHAPISKVKEKPEIEQDIQTFYRLLTPIIGLESAKLALVSYFNGNKQHNSLTSQQILVKDSRLIEIQKSLQEYVF